MFSSLASVSKSKPSTSKSSLIVQLRDTFAALHTEGYALTDEGNTLILRIGIGYILYSPYESISPFPSYEVCQYDLILVLLVVERSYSITIGFAADCPLLHT